MLVSKQDPREMVGCKGHFQCLLHLTQLGARFDARNNIPSCRDDGRNLGTRVRTHPHLSLTCGLRLRAPSMDVGRRPGSRFVERLQRCWPNETISGGGGPQS
jgi:hypothetical protein